MTMPISTSFHSIDFILSWFLTLYIMPHQTNTCHFDHVFISHVHHDQKVHNHPSTRFYFPHFPLHFLLHTPRLHATAKSSVFSGNSSPLSLRLKQEKLSHLHFYFHDIPSCSNPTTIWVARPPTSYKSPTLFGSVAMIYDALTTIGPKRSSKVVGRAQGFYASASQSEDALIMTMNLAFTAGEFNGSSLSVLGRYPVVEAVREMHVTGGSGLFRFARGYVQAKTLTFNATTGDAVEYNVFMSFIINLLILAAQLL